LATNEFYEKRVIEFARSIGVRLSRGMTGRWSRAAADAGWRNIPENYQRAWRDVPNWYKRHKSEELAVKGKAFTQLPHDILVVLDKLFVSHIAGVSATTRVHEPLKGHAFQTTIKHVMNMYNEKALLAPVAHVLTTEHYGTSMRDSRVHSTTVTWSPHSINVCIGVLEVRKKNIDAREANIRTLQQLQDGEISAEDAIAKRSSSSLRSMPRSPGSGSAGAATLVHT
jgi:hypothetical protein